jgi:6-phosphogluconate dehydrogenase
MTHHIGFIGLGKMGKNMVLHLLEQRVDVVAYNRTQEKTDELKHEKPEVKTALSPKELVNQLPAPRIIWLMVPNGAPVDEMIDQLIAGGLSKGDTIVDGGNCYYKDSVRRAKTLEEKGINFIDCGTSGGLEGARTGACLMIGGDEGVVKNLEWLWTSAAIKNGFSYFGPSGAGHFVKMVHNGVEYGMNQSIAEGFEILSKGPYTMNYANVAHNWSHGSVVRGWLIELLAQAFDSDPKLENSSGVVGGGQTGGWTVEAAHEFGVDAIALEDALKAREKSQTKPTFAGKVVSALRAGYGGHK